eukprot:6965681-Alexandrium_andersonii.AAC.1
MGQLLGHRALPLCNLWAASGWWPEISRWAVLGVGYGGFFLAACQSVLQHRVAERVSANG